jgi:tetratricopeptide (TPR) repeat protein
MQRVGKVRAGLVRAGLAAVVVAAVTVAGVVAAGGRSDRPAEAGAPAAQVGNLGPGRDAADAIARAQRRLTQVPGDWTTWAELGVAYVQQARISGDPSYYPRADGVLRRSLRIRPAGNATALVGLGALAAARHDFARALRYGQRAVRLDDASAIAWGVVTDAQVELGRYGAAAESVQRMLDLRPDTGSLTRASYLLELRGDLAGARRMLDLALGYAPTAADAGYVLYYLGELAWNAGDLTTAQARYTEGLRRAPGYLPLLEGRAKVAAARGDRPAALADYATLAARLPLPAYLVGYGDLLAAAGDRAGAERQYAVVRAQQRIAASYGVDVDLDLALFDADNGASAAALREAGTALARRPGVLAEDAYGWALHVAGRDGQALPHARAALRLGTRSALFRYHLGVVEAAAGRTADACRDLSLALATNPHFSPLHAPEARALLARLGAA